jgi:1-acyl-sn-glycerol-3-phosphate acyltransferase
LLTRHFPHPEISCTPIDGDAISRIINDSEGLTQTGLGDAKNARVAMNIYRPQKPYVFHPAKYRPWLAPALLLISELIMRRKFRITTVQAEGIGRLAEISAAGHSLLVAPNHADHPDPHVLLYAGRKHGLHFHFMAAREGFEKSAVNRFMLTHMGAFSVDREGADLAAVKAAMNLVQEGQYPLVIFPEGEIYHHDERLDVLNEGVATILLRASTKVQAGHACYMVPTAIRYTYLPQIAGTFSDRLDKLEASIGWKPRPELEVVQRIHRLGGGLLAVKEEEFLGHAQVGALVERIGSLQIELLKVIEARHGKAKGGMTVPERVRRLRGTIRKELANEKNPPAPARQHDLYDDLDTVFVAAQLYSYPGQYLSESPTVHRIAETILKLEEDVLEHGTYPSPIKAFIRFGEPVDVAKFLAARHLDIKTGVTAATAYLSDQIQKMLQQMSVSYP